MPLVTPRLKKLTVRKHCKILGLKRSTLYYKPCAEKPDNIKMMNLMDRHLTTHPKEGVVSMVYFLRDLWISLRS